MAISVLLDGPVFAGEILKFRLEQNGTLGIENKTQSDDDFTASLLVYTKQWSGADDIATANNDDFVELTPQTTFSRQRNSQVLTAGYYGVRINENAILTVTLTGVLIGAEPDTRKEDLIDRIITQYRESPNLIGMMNTLNQQVCDVQDAVALIPEKFDIDTAVGDQLSIIGRWLGFPRCHNVVSAIPVFGFVCAGETSQYNLRGFCQNAVWVNCGDVATFEVCINDDEFYRRFLYVRRYQLLGMNDYKTFNLCIQILFGDDATYTQVGKAITVNTGRSLTEVEVDFQQVFARVLPRALSATITIQTS